MQADFFYVLRHLEDDEQYQVWVKNNCICNALGRELKDLVWERDALQNVAFACLR